MKIRALLTGVLLICIVTAGHTQGLTLKTGRHCLPVLAGKENNPVLVMQIDAPDSTMRFSVNGIAVRFAGTKGISDLKTVRAYIGDDKKSYPVDMPFCEPVVASGEVVFRGDVQFTGTAVMWLSVELNDVIDLDNLLSAECLYVDTNLGRIEPPQTDSRHTLRIGLSLRDHMQDNVHTYRIPGLTTTKSGTLLAIYDVRRDSSRDLQGNIDIGLSRSTDGGVTWDPMRIILDMGEFGGLPQKFNGVSDACILVDDNTGKIIVAGLWMHGVLDNQGKWIEGLTENSTDWIHQWHRTGSQPGYNFRQTCQFLITESDDDGITWSNPRNITRHGKEKAWWLWAPAPGHGITLEDGTLVMPTQGRNKNGHSFSNISWSKDGGQTWTASNPAFSGVTECMAVQLSNGDIMLNCRSGANRGQKRPNGRVVMVTSDLGRTWREHPTSRKVLTEPTCMASIHKHTWVENGQERSLLLFANPNSWKERRNMTLKVSFDDGMTWPEEHWILLDEFKSRGYSCLTSIGEQYIGILYESSQAEMTFQRISLDEILKR